MQADEDAVSALMARVNCSRQQAQFCLEAAGNNLERAVQLYYDQEGLAAPQAMAGMRSSATPPRPQAPIRSSHRRDRNAGRNPLFRAFDGMLHLVGRAVAFGFHVIGAVGSRVLPPPLLRLLKDIVRVALAGPDEGSADEQARRFIAAFTSRYGESTPQWRDASWQRACHDSHAAGRPLFVYLHSSVHQDTDAFCRQVLCSSDVVALLTQHFVAWGGDVRCSDAYRLSQRLSTINYPCCAVLAQNGSHIDMLLCCEGVIDAVRLCSMLSRVVEQRSAVAAENAARTAARNEERALRAEQDEAYVRALAADRQRDAARQQAAKEKQEQQQAELQARLAVEAERQRIEQRTATVEARRREKASSLTAEPSKDETAACTIRIRLPDGSNHQRRFLNHHTVGAVYDFVDSLPNTTALKYTLNTTFPKRQYGDDARHLTLLDAGLAPQSVLLVQPDDD